MCDISGSTSGGRPAVELMNRALAHRGPDGEGIWAGDGVTLGHRRLAVIDPSQASGQPMVSADGNLVITYNGELYNFRELRASLAGYPFRTRGDTEVVLAAYAAWGPACVDLFNGIFAFAVWDRRARELFLARDHVGIKPLYYFHDRSRFVFSSELKGVVAHPGVPRKLNLDTFRSYFQLLYCPGPETMIAGVRKLAPGHRMLVRGENVSIDRYSSIYALDATEARADSGFAHTAHELRSVVEDACERQLVSDRPVGVYLSGGIDSSAILAAAAARRGGDVDAYSVGFDLTPDEQAEKFNADLELARVTAQHLGVRHHVYTLSSDEALTLLDEAVWHADEPLSNPTVLAQMALARFTKPTATVVLSGDGGDELFGGYRRYRLALLSERYRRFAPARLRRALSGVAALQKLDTPAGLEHFKLFNLHDDSALADSLAVSLADDQTVDAIERSLYRGRDQVSAADALMRADRESWLVEECLMRTDKMGMAAGIEGRVPLLDREVVEYALRLPAEYRVTPFETKRILKAAFRDSLPEELFSQPKRGFFSPAAKWLRQPGMADTLQTTMSATYNPETASLFDWKAIERAFAAHVGHRAYHVNLLWAIMTFQIWAKNFEITL
jgi:asparagine synthase (glutamine-hydrolysing)